MAQPMRTRRVGIRTRSGGLCGLDPPATGTCHSQGDALYGHPSAGVRTVTQRSDTDEANRFHIRPSEPVSPRRSPPTFWSSGSLRPCRREVRITHSACGAAVHLHPVRWPTGGAFTTSRTSRSRTPRSRRTYREGRGVHRCSRSRTHSEVPDTHGPIRHHGDRVC